MYHTVGMVILESYHRVRPAIYTHMYLELYKCRVWCAISHHRVWLVAH